MKYTIVNNRPTYHFYTCLQSLRSPKVIFQSYASGLFVYLKPHFLLHIVYPDLFGFTLGFSGKHPRLFCKWFSETIFGFPSISGVEYVYDYSLLSDSAVRHAVYYQGHHNTSRACPHAHKVTALIKQMAVQLSFLFANAQACLTQTENSWLTNLSQLIHR